MKITTLLSYNSDHQLKSDLLEEVKRHEELDQIIQGNYGKENGKWQGCAVGCSIHSLNKIRGKNYHYSDHSVYEIEFGIPRIIARLQDRIFEGLPAADAKHFPYKFLSVIPVGKNLDPVWRKFLIGLLIDPDEGVIRHAKKDQTKKAIQDVADLLHRSITGKITVEQFREVRRAAAYAAYAAYAAAAADAAAADAAAAAAAYAAAAAADADAADAAAAYAADAAAAYAADAYAAYAADAAAAADDDDADDAADAAAARKRKYVIMADKLIELLSLA